MNRAAETHTDMIASADALLARGTNEDIVHSRSQDIVPQASTSMTACDIPAEPQDTNSNLLGSVQDTRYQNTGSLNMSMEEYAELGKRLYKVWELQEHREQVKSDISKHSTDLEKVGHEIAGLEKELRRLREIDACSRDALELSSRECEALEGEVNEAKRQLRLD